MISEENLMEGWILMEERKQKLVIDGNAFYELDLECLKKKEREQSEEKYMGQSNTKRRRQRG